jgi:hypothetical protein
MQARILEEVLSGNVGVRDGALENKICMACKEGSKDNHKTLKVGIACVTLIDRKWYHNI